MRNQRITLNTKTSKFDFTCGYVIFFFFKNTRSFKAFFLHFDIEVFDTETTPLSPKQRRRKNSPDN